MPALTRDTSPAQLAPGFGLSWIAVAQSLTARARKPAMKRTMETAVSIPMRHPWSSKSCTKNFSRGEIRASTFGRRSLKMLILKTVLVLSAVLQPLLAPLIMLPRMPMKEATKYVSTVQDAIGKARGFCVMSCNCLFHIPNGGNHAGVHGAMLEGALTILHSIKEQIQELHHTHIFCHFKWWLPWFLHWLNWTRVNRTGRPKAQGQEEQAHASPTKTSCIFPAGCLAQFLVNQLHLFDFNLQIVWHSVSRCLEYLKHANDLSHSEPKAHATAMQVLNVCTR